MEHSLQNYLRRRSTQELELFLLDYEKAERSVYEQYIVELICSILAERNTANDRLTE